MAYMVAAYMIIWLASFALIISMVKRQRDLQRELSTLREILDDREVAQVIRQES